MKKLILVMLMSAALLSGCILRDPKPQHSFGYCTEIHIKDSREWHYCRYQETQRISNMIDSWTM